MFALKWLGASIAWLSVLIALVAGRRDLRPPWRRPPTHRPADGLRIRTLLAEHGERDSLGYFATRPDKDAVYSPCGQCVITYRVVNRVSLASGDPIGPAEAWDPAIHAWLAEAGEQAWTPAVMGASEAGAIAYRRAGLTPLHLGDEAILNPAEFRLHGPEMRPVRQAVHRIERAGYTLLVRRHGDVPADELRELVELATAWRRSRTERGFSMSSGRLGDPADRDRVLVVARDRDGTTRGILSLVPWGARGLSLDLMRHDPDAENGLTAFMVVGLMREARALAVERVSLNFAAFRAVFAEGGRIGAGVVLRLWRRILRILSRRWPMESLYLANDRYRPHWAPRYLCFTPRRRIARVVLAAMAAEGFLPLPGRPRPTLEASAIEDAAAPLPSAPAPLVALSAVPALPDHQEQTRVRLAKLDRLRREGTDPYPPVFRKTDSCLAVTSRHAGLPADAGSGERVAVAGRVMLLRDHARVCFATIRDGTGDLQIMLGGEPLADWQATVNIGDHVGVRGEVVTSQTGELSVRAESWVLTAKCLRPLPDKHRGLTDPQARVRQRYLDLLTSADARVGLRARAAVLQSLRGMLTRRGFLEVQTPILQRSYGGAQADPFTTHLNAHDATVYLRIAPELYLKQLAVGGIERIFELGPAFRNEGIDALHHPEFTILEAYQAYADYEDMRALVRELIEEAAMAVRGAGAAVMCAPDGTEHDISGEWPVWTVHDAVGDAIGEQVRPDTEPAVLHELCERAGVRHDPGWDRGALVLRMYEQLVVGRTGQPTFYQDFPVEVCPLARPHRADPRLAERWDLVAFGAELGTACTELTDPIEQRRRLTNAANGSNGADEEFLAAIEYGMPPTGGLGLGVDRLVMLLTGRPIRETLPFPMIRREAS